MTILKFMESFYPSFLPVLNSYNHEVKKADAARPFILHKLGGVYLDLDVQCLREMDASLKGHDAIFQVSYNHLNIAYVKLAH